MFFAFAAFNITYCHFKGIHNGSLARHRCLTFCHALSQRVITRMNYSKDRLSNILSHEVTGGSTFRILLERLQEGDQVLELLRARFKLGHVGMSSDDTLGE